MRKSLLAIPLLAISTVPLLAQMTLSLGPSSPTPAPLGSVITWTAIPGNFQGGTLRYRFRVREAGTPYRTVVDYGPNPSLAWSVTNHEGAYEIESSVKNIETGETASASVTYNINSLVTNGAPVITPTAHPLVFLYSVPPCGSGNRIRVDIQSPEGFVQSTPYQACSDTLTTNVYLAGMRASTRYTAQHVIQGDRTYVNGPSIPFDTPGVSTAPPPLAVLTGGPPPSVDGILLQSIIGGPSVATDLSGNIVWWAPSDLSFLTRPQSGGTFLGIFEDGVQAPSAQFFREFDLAGMTIAETNAERVNEQLTAQGIQPINSFHHEARKLPDGKYLVLASSDRILTDVQGPGAVDVIGDTILVLDSDLRVVWAWDSFDHMDTKRMATLNETCTFHASIACAVWTKADSANDWLHGNSLQLTPDGNILFSIRHQDWVIKIDYATGTGNVLWRLGAGGDFQITSSDPNPWFSHQHDPNFARDGSFLTVYDDGNIRAATDASAHSRGQALVIDEKNRTANLVMNADLGVYSVAVGSAQLLPNGNYHFDSGFITDPVSGNTISQSAEVTPSGQIVYSIQVNAIEYRTFRMQDLYTPPDQVDGVAKQRRR